MSTYTVYIVSKAVVKYREIFFGCAEKLTLNITYLFRDRPSWDQNIAMMLDIT